MKYRNVRTGAVIETPCMVSGADWSEVAPAVKSAEATQTPAVGTKKTTAKKPAARKTTAKKTVAKTSSGKRAANGKQ